jgi:hypothetical protein
MVDIGGRVKLAVLELAYSRDPDSCWLESCDGVDAENERPHPVVKAALPSVLWIKAC